MFVWPGIVCQCLRFVCKRDECVYQGKGIISSEVELLFKICLFVVRRCVSAIFLCLFVGAGCVCS